MSIALKEFPVQIYKSSWNSSYRNSPVKFAVPKLTTPAVSGAPANLTVDWSASFAPVIASFAISDVPIVPEVIFAALMSGMSEADSVVPAVT